MSALFQRIIPCLWNQVTQHICIAELVDSIYMQEIAQGNMMDVYRQAHDSYIANLFGKCFENVNQFYLIKEHADQLNSKDRPGCLMSKPR